LEWYFQSNEHPGFPCLCLRLTSQCMHSDAHPDSKCRHKIGTPGFYATPASKPTAPWTPTTPTLVACRCQLPCRAAPTSCCSSTPQRATTHHNPDQYPCVRERVLPRKHCSNRKHPRSSCTPVGAACSAAQQRCSQLAKQLHAVAAVLMPWPASHTLLGRASAAVLPDALVH
jgi:hypothetical protein